MDVYPDYESLSKAAAEFILAQALIAAAMKGRFVLAVSGGNTPKRAYEYLAGLTEMPWALTHILQSDERYVPPTDPSSNEGMLRAQLLSHVPLPEGNFHAMYSPGGQERAAELYGEVVERTLGEGGVIDLLMLGIGPEGHTASLFPGSPALEETQRLAVPAQGAPPVTQRITLTPPTLTAARATMFLLSGAEKAPILSTVLSPDCDLPAARIAHGSGNVRWFVDQAAEGATRPMT